MYNVAIVGTGLIGTSLGLAIKQAGIKDIQIVGTDRERGHAGKAHRMGAVDRAVGSLASAVEDAELVIVATPVMAMKDVFQAMSSRLREGCLVTDTGGSKSVVLDWAQQYLPRSVSFVGGNPMVSKESSGPEAADGSLFKDKPYCIIPATGTRQEAVRLLTDVIRAIGAKPYFMDVKEHDSFVSAVSHLPLLLSVALVNCTSKSPSWDDIAKLASTQFRDQTSLTSGDPTIQRDVFAGDNPGLVHWIDTFIRELYEIRRILTGDDDGKLEALDKIFTDAVVARNRWLAGMVTHSSRHGAPDSRVPSATESMSALVFGDPGARSRLFGWRDRGGRDSKEKK